MKAVRTAFCWMILQSGGLTDADGTELMELGGHTHIKQILVKALSSPISSVVDYFNLHVERQ